MENSNVRRFGRGQLRTHTPVGTVSLVGAGPGDPDLLTLKAARLLATCDAVVYDELVNPAILLRARCGAELVLAGRRAGGRGVAQSDVIETLVALARSGKRVVRLKGGDPFVFGRGGEEALALAAAGIPWEVVPGVSAGTAAAAYAGIPLTHRGLASSVAFVTGHDVEATDWAALARGADTIAIFMGGRTIDRIARALVDGGRAATTPVALVHRGTCDDQEVFVATLGELADRAPLHLDGPVLTIVGETVRLHEALAWFEGAVDDACERPASRATRRREDAYEPGTAHVAAR